MDKDITPEQIIHARRMMLKCPIWGWLHCWHCSRCDDASRCTVWRAKQLYVIFFRDSERPHSLDIAEELMMLKRKKVVDMPRGLY